MSFLRSDAVVQRTSASGWSYAIAVCIGMVVVATLEWRRDEDTITMAAILVASLCLGFIRPRTFWIPGIVLGSTVFIVNLTVSLTGLQPVYEHAATMPTSATSLVLVVPAMIASAIGAGLSKVISPRRNGG